MLARLRRKQILEVLRAKGGVRLTELSEELSVSEMTIRRDLDSLQKDGLIERVHGGAVLAKFGHRGARLRKKSAPGATTRRLPSPSGRPSWSNQVPPWRCQLVRPRTRWPADCPLPRA